VDAQRDTSLDGSRDNAARDNTGRHDSDDESGDRYGSPVSTTRVVRRLLRGKWILVGAVVLGVAVGIPVAKFLIKHTYTATAMLKFEGLPEIEGLPQEEEPNVGGMLQSIFIEDVLIDIRTRVGRNEPTQILGTMIQYESDQAQVVRITTKTDDPGGSADLANATVEAFLDHQIEVQRSRFEEGVTGLDQRIQAANAALRTAREAYDGFRETHEVADLTTEQEAAIEAAAELRAQRDRTQSEVEALIARVESLQRQLRRTPQTVVSTMTQMADNSELRRLENELTQARANLSDDHPRVQALQQQVATLRAQLNEKGSTTTSRSSNNPRFTSIQSALSEAEADLEAARQRVEGLTRLAAQARERVEQFSSIEGEASQLLGEVRVNEQLVTDLQAQKARLEDAARDPVSGFRVMSRAVPPEFAEPSKKKYIAAAAIPLGFLLLAVLVLLVMELRGLRLQTANEVAFWGKGPVIGASTWPREEQAIDDLIADMDDFVPEAQGKMLVVAATDDAAELAEHFASRLSSDWYDTTLVGAPPFPSDDPDAYSLALPANASGGDIPGSPTAIVPYQPHEHALAEHVDLQAPMALQVEAWDGQQQGPALRRAARLADRVCVVVPAGKVSGFELGKIKTRLGRQGGVGYVLVNVHEHYAGLLDRVGPVEEFWHATRD